MIKKISGFILNGKSTDDFPFLIVEEMNNLNFGESKSELIEINGINGVAKRLNTNRRTVDKSFKLLLNRPTKQQIREFKSWLSKALNLQTSKLIVFNESDVYYKILDLKFEIEAVDMFETYDATVTFVCSPIGFLLDEQNKKHTLTQNGTILFKGTAPSYPTIKIYGNSNTETTLTLDNQTISLKSLTNFYTLECQSENAGLYTAEGTPVLDFWRGDFFRILKNENEPIGVAIGPGISKIEFWGNWGYL